MDNQSHHSILSDYELEVDGVIYRKMKSLNLVVIQDGPDAGKEEQILVHTRSIGDKSITEKKNLLQNQRLTRQRPVGVVEENNMTFLEVIEFEEKWDKNWNPSIFQFLFKRLQSETLDC